jgi:hypothetical protein
MVAGCGSEDLDGSPTANTPTASPTPAPFPIEVSKEVTVEVGSYYHHILDLPKSGWLTYDVSVPGSTDFDVYVFEDGFDSGWDAYQEYQDGNEDRNSDGIIGATDENADGKAEVRKFSLESGKYHFVIDHTEYGGLDGAKPDSDTPALQADIDLTVEKQGL